MTKRTEVGSPLNFRGMTYMPINEMGTIYLFSLIAEKDLNIRIESIQAGFPDCTGVRFLGGGRWERVRIEFEFKASSFFIHPNHDPKECNIVVCWENDLNEERENILKENNVEIIELKSKILELDNPSLEDPQIISKKEFNIEDHYKDRDVSDKVKELFKKLDFEIKKVNSKIWDKYSKTMITYYSPEKVFVSVHFRKNSIAIEVYTNKEELEGFENVPNHENWGRATIHNEQELQKIIPSLEKSFEIIKKAEEEGINTGWYALTPPEKMTWKEAEEHEEIEMEESGEK